MTPEVPGTGAAAVVSVDRDSPVPLYFQIAEQLERAIDEGHLPAGTRLDNEIELAERLAVSRPTLRQAIERLVDHGLLVRRRGVGTVVIPRRVRRPVALTSLYDDLAAAGRHSRTELLRAVTEPAPAHVAQQLDVPEGAPVIALERLRSVDEEPLALMHNVLPGALVRLEPAALSDHGLYQLLRRQGIVPQLAQQTIGARAATAREARLLRVPRGATLLTMVRTTYDGAGRPVEYGSHVYVADRYTFEMSLVAR